MKRNFLQATIIVLGTLSFPAAYAYDSNTTTTPGQTNDTTINQDVNKGGNVNNGGTGQGSSGINPTGTPGTNSTDTTGTGTTGTGTTGTGNSTPGTTTP